ncbi:predicted protein [Sclerotinia sclerotiorum 1980 UF-70]|uniref:Uncharacterized protein n=1 Tax=Sclerotinia sclerotiorum (strain ATCC 18683 / 1980 / Ss-1) TaxID=665079 RepID=A7E462_SCLS1|nr:predicted protein [Sclerotinia sclerotiorum 1980 UF-70]EDN90684.1 predicted protein [Sclerotinia sclerotiorum 1980 UF-70]
MNKKRKTWHAVAHWCGDPSSRLLGDLVNCRCGVRHSLLFAVPCHPSSCGQACKRTSKQASKRDFTPPGNKQYNT